MTTDVETLTSVERILVQVLAVAEAKKRLAATFGVSTEAVEITIRA